MSWYGFAKRLTALEKKYAPRVYRALIGQVRGFTAALRTGVQPDAVLVNQDIGKVLRQMHIEGGVSEGRLQLRALRAQQTKRMGTNEEWMRQILDILSYHNARFVLSISQTTREYLLAQLQKGVEEGMSLNEIANRIDRELDQTYRNRSFAIARTELVRGMNTGTQLAAEKYEYEVEKTWITAGDHRVRGSYQDNNPYDHTVLAGKKVDSDEPFNNGEDIRYPGDPEASPGNTINCRCTIALKGKRDKNGKLIPKPSRLFSTI